MAIVGENEVLYKKEDLISYECDGYTMYKGMPRAVVFVKDTEEVSDVVRCLTKEEIPYIARGAGTGLSGGATPLGGEVLISLVKMKRMLRLDLENRKAVVEPGYINLKLTQSISDKGAHCLKYGVTTNHILGLEIVLPSGEIVEIGEGGVPDQPGYDLLGLLTGSEGTLGIVTKVTVKVLKNPEGKKTALAYFDDIDDASQAVSDIIAAGIIPAALEMMDEIAIEGVESAAYPVGHPRDIAGFLLIEVDGIAAGIDDQIEEILAVCKQNNVREVKVAKDEAERSLWWANRKMGFGAMGAMSPDCLVQDGVIPRTRLPEVLAKITEISRKYDLRIANIFHAGDGNLHPLILFDASVPGESERASKAGSECLKVCADVGGSITGEHGVGIEKSAEMRFIFTDEEIAAQTNIRNVFNPEDLLNPGKLFPQPGRCVEVTRRDHEEMHLVP
ncbi:FAD-linked oxidase C-terminal domain-containing protein [Oceanobacillus alkalisoli]|uniref:FAD-linked oxidase C-terminal domain-containing protein n=1 Tax=Oceanobacillus alkalisoli TaxID=2925113 RepID=UPI001F121DD4|nr:FAD-linked oxidase C-terminal domain-containing protein [Oceanobacillus alkalisoli]MCF3944713.1 FAD-binding protein [Oceanobacillus alkalisoli]